MKNNIALCLFTSTKGHFDIKTRYRETVTSLSKQYGVSSFCNAIAHVKISPDELETFEKMRVELENYGFNVISTGANWKHGDQSHQSEYLNDMRKVFNHPLISECPYALFMEDDMTIHPRTQDLPYYLYEATRILQSNPNTVSVRIARVANERERVAGLREKHGINSIVKDSNRPDLYFYGNDFSNNPHVCRVRDMRNALLLMSKNPGAFMEHSEMGLGPALKYFSQEDESIAIFNPDRIVARHIGTELGQEELADKEYTSS